MTELSSEAKDIRRQGWRQGSLLVINGPIEANGEHRSIESGLYILISQDCDIQTPPLSVEPYVEIISCNSIQNEEGAYTRGKNPRKIHISFRDNNDEKVYYECEAKNRFFLSRTMLANSAPYQKLSIPQDVIDNLVLWLVKRYKRDAFPDSFNQRVDRKKLKKIIKDSQENVEYVIIKLHSEDELPSNIPYDVALNILIVDRVSEQEFKNIEVILDKLINELEKEQIKIIDSAVLTLNQISLGDFLNYRQLDFDDLSFPEI